MITKQSLSKSQAIKIVKRKVRVQVPDRPNENLMFSIFEQALDDAFAARGGSCPELDRLSGREYLRSNMPHLEAVGIEACWVRRLLKDVGLAYS